MNTKMILVVIALLLAGILGVMVYKMDQPKSVTEQIADAVDDAADDVGDAAHDLGDDINDAVNKNQN